MESDDPSNWQCLDDIVFCMEFDYNVLGQQSENRTIKSSNHSHDSHAEKMSLRQHGMKLPSDISKKTDRRLHLQRKMEEVVKRKSEKIKSFKDELEIYFSFFEELTNERTTESDENSEPNQNTSDFNQNRRMTLKRKIEDRIQLKRRGIKTFVDEKEVYENFLNEFTAGKSSHSDNQEKERIADVSNADKKFRRNNLQQK